MALTLVGVSHRTADIEVRERLAHAPHEIPQTLAAVRAETGAREGVLLSTCNRTELYLVEGDRDATEGAWAALSKRLGSDASAHGYVRRERDVVRHLFRVASGLDSMILGETQIQGQVRDAWQMGRSQSSAALNRLFQTALLVAGRVRSETTIGHGAASISSAAVQLAKKIFGSLQGRRAMILGAGEMAELALECLAAQGVRTTIVANRTYDRASTIASHHGATAMHYDECWPRLAEVDVMVCSTSAPHAIVATAHIEPTLAARGDRPLCILDIALPRDVDPAVGGLDNVYLYDLDDLRQVVAATVDQRRSEVPSADRLIEEEVEAYWSWLAGLAAVPVLTEFRARMDDVRERELRQLLRRLEHLPHSDRQTIELFSRALMNKFMHEPSVRLREAAANGRGLGIVDAVRYLFALEDEARSAEKSVEDDR
ncbi:MAG TPA: glutamyl-tRNA reductase [Gemmatimonadaceae bacterium]|nr:glutamyl-tRNA reductase [Gemmatimonadaceae bacterium]